jgi:long-chain-alcohol oxidase
MGTSPSNSATSPRGALWGTTSLYVADASVFPTASGVNPMITTMATSHSIAQFIDQDLRSGVNSGMGTVEARL